MTHGRDNYNKNYGNVKMEKMIFPAGCQKQTVSGAAVKEEKVAVAFFR